MYLKLTDATRKDILRKNKKIYVSIDQLLDMIFKLFSQDISDPEGITDRIETEEIEESDEDYLTDDEEEKKDADATPNRSRKGTFDDTYIDPMKSSMMRIKNIPKANTTSKLPGTPAPAPSGTILSQRSLIKRNQSLIDESDDMKTEESEKIKEQTQKMAAERMELFRKDEITASAVKMEVESIFGKLKNRRKLKITETTIDYYRREGLKKVRLLQDDEALRFIYEQLSRYVTFNPKEREQQFDLNVFKRILVNTLAFDSNSQYHIDDETIPKMVRNNDQYIEQLYKHLTEIFTETQFIGVVKDEKQKMTLEDAVSIILLYQRIFSVLSSKIVDSADEFVVNHDLFCKFVDPSFNIDESHQKWNNKTKAASNLYQSVLDIQQNVSFIIFLLCFVFIFLSIYVIFHYYIVCNIGTNSSNY